MRRSGGWDGRWVRIEWFGAVWKEEDSGFRFRPCGSRRRIAVTGISKKSAIDRLVALRRSRAGQGRHSRRTFLLDEG